MEEVWKPIISYQGVVGYEISSIMRIKDGNGKILEEDDSGYVCLMAKRTHRAYGKTVNNLVGVRVKAASVYAKDFLGYSVQITFSNYSKKPTANDVLRAVQDSIKTFNKPKERNGVHGVGKDRYVMHHNSRTIPIMIHGREDAMKNYVELFVQDKSLGD